MKPTREGYTPELTKRLAEQRPVHVVGLQIALRMIPAVPI
jgi:hypothetical protein